MLQNLHDEDEDLNHLNQAILVSLILQLLGHTFPTESMLTPQFY